MSHKYKVTRDDIEYSLPSVTTIIGDCTDKSGALTQWAANQVVEWIKENVGQEDMGVYSVSAKQLNEARFNFRSVSKEALDIGSQTHNAIETYLKTGKDPVDLPEQAETAFLAFLEWADENKIETLETEQRVVSEFWAGTLDWVGMFNGKKYVVDWKTSKGFYGRDYFYQIAAYRSLVPDCEGCGVLRIDKLTGKPEWKDSSNKYYDDLAVYHTMVELYFKKHPRLAVKAGWEPPF